MERQSTRRLFNLAVALVSLLFLCLGLAAFSACGEDNKAHTHTWVDAETIVQATCNQPGSKRQTCSECGESQIVPTAMTQHNWQATSTVQPTCSTPGYTVETCSSCGNSRQTNQTPATGHTWAKVDAKSYEASCTQTGLLTEECSSCGASRSNTLPKTEHNYDKTTVPAQCDTKGYDHHVCKDCHYSYDDNFTPDVRHHHYIIDQDTFRPANCVENAYGKYVCEYCGDQPDSIGYLTGPGYEKLGHLYEKDDFGEIVYTEIQKRTCELNGIQQAECTRETCKPEYEGHILKKVQAATGHNINGTGKSELGEVMQTVGGRHAAPCLPDDGLNIATDSTVKFAYYCVNPWCDVTTEGATSTQYCEHTVDKDGKVTDEIATNGKCHWFPVEDHAQFDLASAGLLKAMSKELSSDHKETSSFTGKEKVFTAPTCTTKGTAEHVCPVCYTVQEDVQANFTAEQLEKYGEVEAEELKALGHTFDFETRLEVTGVDTHSLHTKQLDGKASYAPCEPDSLIGSKYFTTYRDYLAKYGLTKDFRERAGKWKSFSENEDAPKDPTDLNTLISTPGKQFAAVCRECGALQETTGHEYLVKKYLPTDETKDLAPDKQVASDTLEPKENWIPYDEFEGTLTCWYAVECEYYELCHSTAGNAQHSPAKANNKDGLYANCRHGIQCTVCYKELTSPTNHSWIDLTTLKQTDQLYKDWVAASEMEGFPEALDPAKVAQKATCQVEGYETAKLCKYCLAAFLAGDDVDGFSTLKNVTPTTSGTTTTTPSSSEAENCGIYAVKKGPHTFDEDYANRYKDEDGNVIVSEMHYYSDNAGKNEITGRLDCLTIVSAKETCGLCGKEHAVKSGASYKTSFDDTSATDTLSTGLYKWTRGQHQVALFANYATNPYFAAPTCVDVATLPVVCVVCGTQLQIAANQNDFLWAKSDKIGASKVVEAEEVICFEDKESSKFYDEAAKKYNFANVKNTFDYAAKEGAYDAASNASYVDAFIKLNKNNHQHTKEEMAKDTLACSAHCEAVSETLTYADVFVGGIAAEEKYTADDHKTLDPKAFVECKRDLDHSTIVITYKYSEKDPYKLNGATAEILYDGVTEDEDGNPLDSEDPGSGYIAPVVTEVSRCNLKDGAKWEDGIDFTLLTRDQVVLTAPDGETVYEGAKLLIYKESNLDEKSIVNYESVEATTDPIESTKVFENDTFFFTFVRDEEKDPAFELNLEADKFDLEKEGSIITEIKEDSKEIPEGYYQLAEGEVVEAKRPASGNAAAWYFAGDNEETGTEIKETIVDLNGGTMSWNSPANAIWRYSKVVIKNGTLNLSGMQNTAGANDPEFVAAVLYVAGDLTLENMQIVAEGKGIEVLHGGKLTMKNSTLIALDDALIVSGRGSETNESSESLQFTPYKQLSGRLNSGDPEVNIENSVIISLARITHENDSNHYNTEASAKLNHFEPFNGITVAAGKVTMKNSYVAGSAHAISVTGKCELKLEGSTLATGILKITDIRDDSEKAAEGLAMLSYAHKQFGVELSETENGSVYELREGILDGSVELPFEKDGYLGKVFAEGSDNASLKETWINGDESVEYIPAEEYALAALSITLANGTSGTDVNSATVDVKTTQFVSEVKVYAEAKIEESKNYSSVIFTADASLKAEDIYAQKGGDVKLNGRTVTPQA